MKKYINIDALGINPSKPLKRKVIFAAMSRSNFYLREHIIKYILEKGHTPTCAFMMYSYFLLDTVDRKRLIEATNDLLSISDELWVFGEISNGVFEEIKLARKLKYPITYFKVNDNGTFTKTSVK